MFFLALLAMVLFLTWIVFKPFVLYMVTGIFVAVLALPIDKFWERTWQTILPPIAAALRPIGAPFRALFRLLRLRKKKKHDPDGQEIVPWARAANVAAAFSTMFSIFLIITVPLVLIGWALVGDAQQAANNIDGDTLENSINRTLNALPWTANQTAEERTNFTASVVDAIEPRAKALLGQFLSSAVGFVGKLAIAVTIILFVTYYVLKDGGRLVGYLKRALPLPDRQVDKMLHEAHGGLKGVFFGQILTSMIQGAIGGIGFIIAGIPGAVIWSAVMAIMSLLPVIGAFVVWIPAAIWLIVTGDLAMGIFLIIWGVVVISQIDNIIKPLLIGGRTEIHPLFVLVGVLGGVAAWGFIGLFLGPLLVGVTISILKVWESDYLDPELAPAPPPSPLDKDRARDDGL